MSGNAGGGRQPGAGAPIWTRWERRLIIVLVAASALALTVAAVLIWSPHPHRPAARSAPPDPWRELVAARARAGLRPCPSPLLNRPQPVSLRGVRAQCLGDGAPIDVGAALAGRTTLLNLWASWCAVCRHELPLLEAYTRTPGAVQVLGIQVHDEPVDGLSLLAAVGVRLPSVTDPDDMVIRALRAPAYLPVSYVITPDGMIRQVLPPTPFASVDQIDRAVRSLTAVPSGLSSDESAGTEAAERGRVPASAGNP